MLRSMKINGAAWAVESVHLLCVCASLSLNIENMFKKHVEAVAPKGSSGLGRNQPPYRKKKL